MNVLMPSSCAEGYRSASQRARVVSETWAAENLYCPACPHDTLNALPANTKSIDFSCARCGSGYQLKSASQGFGRCILDGAYASMRETIIAGRAPSIFMLHYDLARWRVNNLTVIPSFAFSLSSIVCRKPLAATARRAGWVGCNIVLTNIPPDARIAVVRNGVEEKRVLVREQFSRLRPFARLSAVQKGWTLDVLNVVRRIGNRTFTLKHVLMFAPELQRLHPENKHIEAKVRQQLQRLRDLGLLVFVDGHGTYRACDL